MNRNCYQAPVVLREVRVQGDCDILQGSIITDDSVVLSLGHETGNTYGGTPETGGEFNFNWE